MVAREDRDAKEAFSFRARIRVVCSGVPVVPPGRSCAHPPDGWRTVRAFDETVDGSIGVSDGWGSGGSVGSSGAIGDHRAKLIFWGGVIRQQPLPSDGTSHFSFSRGGAGSEWGQGVCVSQAQ